MDIIFGRPKVRFGNVWAFTSRMILHGIRNNLKDVYISSHSKRVSLVQEMWECFDNKNINLKVTDEHSNTSKKYGVPEHKEPYVETKVKWSGIDNKKICYQLETESTRRHPDKLFNGDVKEFIDELNSMGIETIKLGIPLTMQESINIASECSCFIGICSGMAHVCYSVGIPIYLQNWKQLSKFHPNKKYTTYNSSSDLLSLMKEKYNEQ